jgi:hypothetical protein
LGRIVEMNIWDNDFLDLVEKAHLTFGGKSNSEIVLAALKGFPDVSYGTRDGSACAELSCDGHYDLIRHHRHRGSPCRSIPYPQR